MSHEAITIKLGDEVEDVTCGFRGIAVAYVEYLSGVTEYGIQPPHVEATNELKSVQYINSRYIVKVGDGVRVKKSKAPMGFNAE